MFHDLAGKRVLVVGTGGGIGAATARSRVRAEPHVVVARRSGPKLVGIAGEVGGDIAGLLFVPTVTIEGDGTIPRG
jgi:NAD(P)-dependent dehydrogenase (short-subunit alcohol dehydrogenase family)